MLSCNLLRVAFARHGSVRCQMPCLRSPMSGEETRDAAGLQEGFEVQHHLGLAVTKDVRQDLSGPVLNGMPQPAWLLLLAHEAPPFVDLRGLHSVNATSYVTWS
jgi:hypothetical protein